MKLKRLIIFLFLLNLPLWASYSESRDNVFVIHSTEPEYYWNSDIRNSIKNYFDSGFRNIDITNIPVDFTRLEEIIIKDSALDFFRYVKQPARPSLLITIDRRSFEFVKKYREKYFRDIPLVFCGIPDYQQSDIAGLTHATGVIEPIDINHFLNTAIRLHPQRKNFIVILDSSQVSLTNRKLLDRQVPQFSAYKFIYLENASVSSIKELNSIQNNSIILLFGTLLNNSGIQLSYPRSASYLNKNINSPIYSLNNTGISFGTLGARVFKKYQQGVEASEVVENILNGADIRKIPVKIDPSYRYMFDYRLIEKYDVAVSMLPLDVFIVKRPKSFFDLYGVYLIIGICIIILLLLVIIFLIINFRKRTRAEEALHISEGRLKLALNATNDGIWDWNLSTGTIYFSPRWLEILGLLEDQVENTLTGWQKFIHPDDLDRVLADINLHLKGKTQLYESEYRMISAEGEWKWILDRGKIVEWDKNHQPLRLIGTHQDITQRKNFEVELLERERKFRSIFESSTDGIALLNEEGVIIEWNKGLENITGISKAEAIGQSQIDIQNRLLPDGHPRKIISETYRKEIKEALRTGEAPWLNKLMEVEIFSKDTGKKIAQQLVFPIHGKSGYMAGSITRDITELKQTEEALRRSEKKFRELSDMLPQTVFEIDLKGNLTFGNNAAFEMFGRDKKDLPYVNIFNYLAPEEHPKARKNLERVLRNEKFMEEYTALKHDGTRFPVLIHSTPIIENNTVIGFRGIIIDITERKRNEEAVIESEAKYRTLIETQSEGVILIDQGENITFSNPSANTIFGLKNESLVGKNLREFTSPEEYAKMVSQSDERLQGVKSVFELEIIRKDGTNGCVLFTVTPYKNKRGEVVGSFAVFTDITERKKAEADLIEAKEKAERSNRLKTEFLAQVSHEIRTPINSILSFTSLLKDELEDKIPDDLSSSFRIIENGGRRLIRTIDLILNMSQVQTGTYEGKMVLLDIERDVIDAVILELLPAIREKKLGFNFSNEGVVKRILADQYTVIQIFTNLLDNAVKYTPSGRIDITARYCDEQIAIEISDTGIGISKEYLPHLFTAFSQEESGYTRRFDGNGLGLALVKKYCELNNARITVESEKGRGTKFTIFFPAV